MRRALIGRQTALASSTPASECWPEERAWREAELRRSRGGRRQQFFGCFPPARDLQPEVIVSSEERGAHRKTDCAGELSSGERMSAGGERVEGGRTPAKPRWSEVIIFWDVFLRQGTPNRRKPSAPTSGALIGSGDVPAHVLCVDTCLLYTSDAADEEDSVDLGGRRIVKKNKNTESN
eukprot:TRINITY_DN13712_c0_g1_i4.p2 TRINITY_DN13712_c0_g1~~TRINITY_DN13712_c0_g1_i4.p2  ORF type:complete len:178 (-),score=13.21 TRINITY_DN13712_c0_g1_i4:25-558(-)